MIRGVAAGIFSRRIFCCLLYVLVVFLSRHEVPGFVRVREANPNHPSCPVRVFIDLFGRSAEIFIDFDHLAGHGNKQLRYGFHGFDASKRLAGVEFHSGFWQFDVHDITEFLLSMVADADGACFAYNPQPLVFFCEKQIIWSH